MHTIVSLGSFFCSSPFPSHAEITVSRLREAIVEGAEERRIGEDKTIRLLNPTRSFEMAVERFTLAE